MASNAASAVVTLCDQTQALSVGDMHADDASGDGLRGQRSASMEILNRTKREAPAEYTKLEKPGTKPRDPSSQNRLIGDLLAGASTEYD